MKKLTFIVGIGLIASGCGQKNREVANASVEYSISKAPTSSTSTSSGGVVGVEFAAEEASAANAAADVAPARYAPPNPEGEPNAGIPATAPQIAYHYNFSYSLSGDDVAKAQQAHIAQCDKLGPQKCRVMTQRRAASSASWGTLSLQVDSKIARQFGDQLDAAVSGLGGDAAMREVEAEDVSKDMVDAGARIKAKQALADRLLLLIQRRDGKVADLVEAERAFAEAQEELEAARKWMTELQGRVAMSAFDIEYNPGNQDRARSPQYTWLGEAISNAGITLANSLAALITFLVAVLPWALVVWFMVRLIRWRGWLRNWRWRFWRRKAELELDETAEV
jgi:citrate lyase gamma subunit